MTLDLAHRSSPKIRGQWTSRGLDHRAGSEGESGMWESWFAGGGDGIRGWTIKAWESDVGGIRNVGIRCGGLGLGIRELSKTGE